MNTPQSRYEVGNDIVGVSQFVPTFSEAVRVAQHLIELDSIPAYICDRMAHKSRPWLYGVEACTGEAHKNPHIDHCALCAPYWGIVVRPA